ncbi:GTP cyclohydrolase-2 [Striga asiatica]|uniref:GTP cyclohydrolase-2 n=1 Tax=Striga asiatica TaxID=4170 RepID=A0A5A7Q243_STRAF|nr:GTP cyclohydrolase-2 [Striga asiatica]
MRLALFRTGRKRVLRIALFDLVSIMEETRRHNNCRTSPSFSLHSSCLELNFKLVTSLRKLQSGMLASLISQRGKGGLAFLSFINPPVALTLLTNWIFTKNVFQLRLPLSRLSLLGQLAYFVVRWELLECLRSVDPGNLASHRLEL